MSKIHAVRKLLVTLFLSVFSVFVFTSLASAQQAAETVESSQGMEAPSKLIAEPDYYPPPISEPGFLGQDHKYTVVFRGNGEAVVSARIVFTNKGEESLEEIGLRVPRVEPRDISVYQVVMQGRCIRYETRIFDPDTRTYNPQVCAEYADPDYYQSYGSAKYQKADYELDIDTLKITLPNKIAANASGSFFVYFRAMGYAGKDIFGAYEYTFESMKAEDDIRNLQIGISTDSDLILKGVKGEVSYRYEAPALGSLESAGASFAPQKSAAIDTYVSQIGRGRVAKTASNLAPLESYTVTGAYASSRIKLYGKPIALVVGVLLVLGAIIAAIVRYALKKLRKVKVEAKDTTTEKRIKISTSSGLILASLGLSFVSSLLIVGYTFGIYVVGSLLDSIVGYQFQAIFALFLVVISFIIYAVLVFAPSVYLGVKKGISWGIATLVFTVIWLMFFIVVGIFIILLFGRSSRNSLFPLIDL